MKVALVQFTAQANLADNLERLSVFIQEGAHSGARLLVLPEMFPLISEKPGSTFAQAESFGSGPIQEFISAKAKHYNIWIVAGTIPIKSDIKNKFFASCLVYDSEGCVVGRYDKIHLFDVKISEKESHSESTFTVPGETTVVIDTPIGKLGLAVCYDLRFPELFRELVRKGAEVIAIPSAFTATTGKAHWDILLRARAIENLCYILAANQTGQHHSKRESYGHSCIINPWGEILFSLDSQEGIVVGSLDLEQEKTIRRDFPCLSHHRINCGE